MRRHGRHQYASRRVVRLQILLHDKTAHRVADDHRRCRQTVSNDSDVLDEVRDRTGAQRLLRRAVAMAAQADRQSAITLLSEEVQKVLIPTPRRMPCPVDEKQWNRVRLTGTPPVDHLKHVAHGFSCALGTWQAS